MILFSLSLSADFQHGNRCHLGKFTGAGSSSHGNKRIIATAACHGIKLIFPSLEALFEFFLHIRKCFSLRHICGYSQSLIFCQGSIIGFLGVWL